jgi:exodeoxyribonuclease V alpha subunit
VDGDGRVVALRGMDGDRYEAWVASNTIAVRDSIAAINGIGHAAVMCDPGFREALAAHGYSLNSSTGDW